MNMNIKTIIGIIAITFSGFSIAQAGEKGHGGGHSSSSSSSSSSSNDNSYQKPHNRPQASQGRVHNRSYGNNNSYKKHGYRGGRPHARRGSSWRPHGGYRYSGYTHSAYRAPSYYSGYTHSGYYSPSYYGSYTHSPSYYSAPVYPHSVVVSGGHPGDALPALAGGVIGAAIASDASGGDAGSILGGALFGAIVGSAISH